MIAAESTQIATSIHHMGQTVIVEDRIAEQLESLRTRGHHWENDESGAGRLVRGQRNFAIAKNTYPAGLLPRIEENLRKAGLHPELLRHCGPVELSEAPLESGQFAIDIFNKMVHENYRGLVHLTEASLAASLIDGVANAFPHAQIAIVSQSRNRLTNVASIVNSLITVMSKNSAIQQEVRIVFGTIADMATNEVNTGQRDILIFLNATDILHQSAAGLLQTPDQKFRLFGFLPQNRKLSPGERDRLKAWFGPAELTILSKDKIVRPVRIKFCKTRRAGGERFSGELSSSELKQQGIWNHEARNRLVARRAQQFVENDWESLHLDHISYSQSFVTGKRPKTAILVDDPLHACCLGELLPDWNVAPLKDRECEALLQEQMSLDSERLLPLGEQDADQTILTFDTCTPARLAGLDVLIRADGGLGLPWCLRETVTHNKNSRPLLVVDFFDEHHWKLKQWTKTRKASYANRGWSRIEEEQNR